MGHQTTGSWEGSKRGTQRGHQNTSCGSEKGDLKKMSPKYFIESPKNGSVNGGKLIRTTPPPPAAGMGALGAVGLCLLQGLPGLLEGGLRGVQRPLTMNMNPRLDAEWREKTTSSFGNGPINGGRSEFLMCCDGAKRSDPLKHGAPGPNDGAETVEPFFQTMVAACKWQPNTDFNQ